jgi:hypothetical protein
VKALEAEVKASQDALSALVMHINATEEKVRSVTKLRGSQCAFSPPSPT